MISSAPAGFETVSLGDQFAAARGDLADVSVFDVGLAPNPADTLSVNPAPAPIIDPMGFFAGRPAPEQGPADPVKVLQDRLRAATNNTSGTWKAADNVRPDSVIKGVGGLARSHSENTKGVAAADMKAAQVAEIRSILKESAELGIGPVAQASGSGRMAGNFAADALLTAGATALMGPVGIIVATGMMAARAGLSGTGLEGQGTLVTFNQTPGYFSTTSSSRSSRARDNTPPDYGYGSPLSTPQQVVSAPVSNAFQQGMNKGPGFGRADILADLEMPGQTFDQIAIRIAEDSPAGKAVEGMRLNSRRTTNSLLAQRDGVVATADNIKDAMEIGIDVPRQVPQGMKIPTFKMA